MLEESGRVVNVDSEGVWVETIKLSACNACSARSGCGQALLASVGQGKRSVICVDNPAALPVAVTDNVTIGIAETAFLKISVLLYLIPLLTLFFAAFLAEIAELGEPAVIGLAFSGLALGLLLVRFISRRLMTSCRYHPVLLNVL
ncbi:MAG: SoxR reducing system RseC family protein [Pontibacterium sp.]